MSRAFLPRVLSASLLAATCSCVHAGLIDYYTLDNQSLSTGGGLVDGSGNATGGGDLITQQGTGATTVISGIIGSALSFDGTTNYNSGTVPAANVTFPFSESIWVNTTSTAGPTRKALGLMDTSFQGYDFSAALSAAGSSLYGSSVARNAVSGLSSTTGGAALNDGQWHLLTTVFTSATDRSLFVDGQFAASSNTSETLFPASATTVLEVGGFYRKNNGSQVLSDPFIGGLDDAGFFNNSLTASDVALIYGLGETGGIGEFGHDPLMARNGLSERGLYPQLLRADCGKSSASLQILPIAER